jgi:hypothetical protein
MTTQSRRNCQGLESGSSEGTAGCHTSPGVKQVTSRWRDRELTGAGRRNVPRLGVSSGGGVTSSRTRTALVYAEQYIAQHHPERASARDIVGYFPTLEEAQTQLDAVYDGNAWQGIRNERTGERWVRDNGSWVTTTPAG